MYEDVDVPGETTDPGGIPKKKCKLVKLTPKQAAIDWSPAMREGFWATKAALIEKVELYLPKELPSLMHGGALARMPPTMPSARCLNRNMMMVSGTEVPFCRVNYKGIRRPRRTKKQRLDRSVGLYARKRRML